MLRHIAYTMEFYSSIVDSLIICLGTGPGQPFPLNPGDPRLQILYLVP